MKELINILHEENLTLIVKSADGSLHRFTQRGVKDLLTLVSERPEVLEGAIIADKAVGKAAAACMEMSYSKAWKILKRAEQEMGTELINRVSGGKNGGSSTLTEAGETAVKTFREIETKVTEYAGELLKASEWGENSGGF